MVGKRATAVLAVAVLVIAQLAGNNHVQADILCYACSSYMSQCQPELLASDVRNVFKARCSGKCFIRQGEDNATYRGCFDGFSSVVDLTDGYLGCRSQTWNNKRRQWCLCNTDLCNVHFDLQPPLPPSQHQRHPLPSVTHNNGAPPPTFGHQIPSKHPVRPSQDRRSEFFESFADKAKYRQSAASAPSEGLAFPEDYVQQPRPNEASAGRNLTNYNEGRPLDHFKEQDDHDVLIEEPIAFNHVQDKRNDDMTSHRPLLLTGQTKKVIQKKLEDNDRPSTDMSEITYELDDTDRPSKGIKQITYDADMMSIESLDYPYNQDERYRTISVSPQVSELEALDDLENGRKSDSVQADGPDNLLKNSDPTTMKVAYGITATDKGKELKTEEAQRDLEKNPTYEKLDSVFTEDAIDPDLSEDYPYNQIFNQELAKEDLELLTKPRPFELRFSQTLDPSSESAQKQESAKSTTLEVHNDNSKEQGQESTRPKEGAVRAKEFRHKEFLSPNELIRPGSLNDKQRNRPQSNQGEEIDRSDARERLAIRDADILWIGQDRAPDDADPSYFTISENSEHKKTALARGPVGSKLERGAPYRHHMELEMKNHGEEEETRSGKEADMKEAQSFDQDGQEAKNLERTGVDRRTGVREQQNEEEQFSSQTNKVEQTTLKTATTIRCFRTGYYDNPTDCTQFIACLLDPRSRAYILHFMRCPAGLSWDNTRKLCMESSSTCYSNNRSHSNGANSIVSPEAGVQLTQKHLLLANGVAL